MGSCLLHCKDLASFHYPGGTYKYVTSSDYCVFILQLYSYYYVVTAVFRWAIIFGRPFYVVFKLCNLTVSILAILTTQAVCTSM